MNQVRNPGTFWGVGVGPGNPELLTLEAVRILGEVDVVFAASSTKNDFSTAHRIAAPHMTDGVDVIELGFPMTHDKQRLEDAWNANAETVASHMLAGKNGAFLTLGDPLIYSTFGYLMEKLQTGWPEIQIRVSPGITSFQAAAASSRTVLVSAGESLVLTSGQADAERFKKLCDSAENAVVLKAYKNYPAIVNMVRQAGSFERALFCSRLGMEGERICEDLDAVTETPHYFSLLLMKRKGRKAEEVPLN